MNITPPGTQSPKISRHKGSPFSEDMTRRPLASDLGARRLVRRQVVCLPRSDKQVPSFKFVCDLKAFRWYLALYNLSKGLAVETHAA